MPVIILNLSGLDVVDFRETDTEYHVRAMPKAISRLCPHCGRSDDTVVHAKRTLVIRDIPSYGKSVVIHEILCCDCPHASMCTQNGLLRANGTIPGKSRQKRRSS